MSLLGGMMYDKKRRFMDGMIRYERIDEIFFDTLIANPIIVETNADICLITPDSIIQTPSHQPVGFVSAYMQLDVWKKTWDGVRDVDRPRYVTISHILESLISGPNEDKVELSVHAQDCVLIPFDKNGRRPYHISGGYVGEGGFIGQPYAYYQSVIQPYFFVKQYSVDEQVDSHVLRPPFGGNLKSIIQYIPALRREVANLLQHTGHKLSLRM
nr:hypothetical protein [Tanacetum cinerariifolium]